MEDEADPKDIRPWMPFSFGEEEYLVKAVVKDNPPSCTVLMTDLISVWRGSLDDGEQIRTLVEVCVCVRACVCRCGWAWV